MVGRGFASETTVHESYDGKTRIKQFLRVKAATAAANSGKTHLPAPFAHRRFSRHGTRGLYIGKFHN
ncbi:hypothetical protein NVIE_2045 [Nitrososphaera viennensis EN76]|uniref:Uncharacterized protein n=1 Tax=Nitrososphaera viennensis EN76 TaxID=926571 RepID=A0A060HI38_9ARCH|nr:hypothetical protein NVIE_2045 [Nitrososphaera viennensis EN76]